MPIDYNEFAEKIKAKYPEYKDLDNYTLASKMVEKYPEYQGKVDLKKKDPMASGSGTSSSGRLSNTTTKPTASSSSKGEIFTGYPGKEEKPYQFKDGKWYEEAPVKVYGQKAQYVQIQDPNRIGNLNKQFKKDASLSQEYELFNNYDDEKADNQYRIKDGQWQRMTPGSKWHTIQNEGSINALNNRYGKSVSTRVVTTTTMKPAKFDDINSDFVAKTEENAIKYLTEKYGKYGFEFSEEGAFAFDQIRVKTKDGSKEILVEFDEKNPEQARELRAFLEVNATKSYSENFDKALNSLNKFEGKDQMSGPKMGTGQYGYQQQSAIIRGKNLLSNEFQSEFKKLPFEEQKEIIQEQIIGTGLPTNDVQSFYKSAAYQDYKKKKVGGDQQSKSKQDQIYDDYQYALATKDPAKIKEAKAKIDAYYTDDIIQDNVKTYNMKLNDFEQSQKNILQDRKAYDEEVSRFNELAQSGKMTQEQYDAQKKILDDKAESLETRAQNFVMQKKEIQASQNKLNLVAGKYVAAKEKEGNLGGFLVNKVLTGVSMAFVEPFAALEASAEKRYDQLSPEEKAYYKSIKYNGKNLTKDQIENLLDNQAMLKAKNEAKESIIKTLGAEGTTLEYMKSGDRGFFTQAIGGVLESLPAMATGIAGKAAGFTGLALQAYSGIEEEMLSDPDFQYTSAGDRAIIAIPYATGMGVLENVGLQNLVKGDSFLGKVMMDVAIKSAKKLGANATKEALERVAAKEVESLLAKGLIRVTQAGVAEFETGFTQALVLDQGLKQAYNWIQQSGMTEEQRKKLTQGEYFDTADTLKELGSKTFEDGVAEMIGGFTMGSVGTVLQAVVNGNISLYNEDDVKFLKDVVVDSNFKKLYVASMKTQMLDGKITKSKAQQNLDNLNEIEAAFDMMPDGLSTADMNTSLSLITERAQLTREKAGKDPNLVAPLEARIKAINEELTKIGENAVQEQATSEVSVQPGAKGGREVEERKPETGLKETTQKGKEEVDQYIADMGAEARIGNTINPVMEKMANAEYINDNDIDNAIEAIFNEVESLDKSDYSVETKAALSEKLLNIAEKLDNYEFRTKTETVATTKAGAATTTRRTSEAVQKIRAEKYFDGVQATVNGQEVTLTDNKGRVEAQMPNGEVVVLDTPTMEIAEDGFEFDDNGALQAVTVTDRLGNTARITGDQALDFAIRDRENKLGVVEQAEFDTVYQEVEKKYIKETPTTQVVAEEEAVVEEQQPAVEEEAVVEEEEQPIAKPSEANRFTERNAKVMAVKFPKKKGIVKAALNVIKALPGVKIYLHEDSDQYAQELASRTGETKQSIQSEDSAGSYIDGEIHIDMSKADVVTLLHEAFHHAFLTLGVKNGMFIDLAKGLRSIIKDKATLAELDEFVASYSEETAELQAEEFATQLGAILANNREELTTTKLTQFKALINRIAKKIGLGMVFSAAANRKEAADFINAISRGLITGDEINSMGISGVINAANITRKKSILATGTFERYPVNPNTKVEENVPLSRFDGKKSNVFESDRMTGAFIADDEGNKLFNFFGGIFYPVITGKWWASNTMTKASGIARNSKRDADGYIYGTPIIMKPGSQMSNNDMLLATLELMKMDALKKNSGVTKAELMLYIEKAFDKKKIADKKNIIKNALKRSNNIEQIFDELEYTLFQKEGFIKDRNGNDILNDNGQRIKSLTFEERKEFVSGVLGDRKVVSDKFPSAGSMSAMAEKFTEPETQKSKNVHDIVIVYRTKGDLVAKKSDKKDSFYHKSYPYEIAPVNQDGSSAEIEVFILDGAYNLSEAIKELTKSSGETFSYEEYYNKIEQGKYKSEKVALAQYGRTAKLSYASGEISARKKQLIAPNGKPSNLSNKQWEQVRTPAFKKWFGDWENDPKNASKAVDENGEPLIVYHGSSGGFDEFKEEYLGDVTQTEISQMGFFFTNNENVAKTFQFVAQEPNMADLEKIVLSMSYDEMVEFNEAVMKTLHFRKGGKIEDEYDEPYEDFLRDIENDSQVGNLPDSNGFIGKAVNFLKSKGIEFTPYVGGEMYKVFLNIRNPFEINAGGGLLDNSQSISYDQNKYDGVIVRNTLDSIPMSEKDGGIESDVFITKNPNSIKSATDNVGTFDKTTSKIKFQKTPSKPLTTDKDAMPGADAALEALGETEAQREAWKKENKVNQKQKRNPIVEQAAKDYFNEEITQEEYLDTVAKNQPIKLFKNVPRLPSLKEIVNSLKDNQVATGIIGLTKNLVDGARVACRLDIPAYEWFDTWVVSIHDGVKEGKSIAYGQTAVLKNVDFKTFPGTAMRIATGSQKTTIARMFGDWVNEDPKSVHARAEELMNDPAWTQVGMNPFRYSWFYDKSDGMPVVSADEVIQVGALVLAKNVKKVSPNDPMFETKSAKGGKIKFQKAPKILGVKPTVVIVNDEHRALVDQIKLEVRAQREQKKAHKQVLADISARVTALKSKGNISVKQFDAIMKNLKRLNFDNETKVQAFIDYVSRALANADYVEKVAKAQSLNKRIKASLKGTANPFAVLAKMFTTLDSRWVQNIDDHIAVAQMILDGVKPSTARRGVLTLKEEPDLQVIAEYIDAEQTLQTQMLLDNLKARYERITGKPAAKLDAKTMLTELQSLNPTVDQTDKIKQQIDEKLAEYADMLTDEDPQVIVDAINIDTDIMDWKDAVKVLDSLDTYFTNGSLAGIEALMGTYKGLENAKKFKYKSSPISVLGIKPLGRTRFKKLVGFPSIMERKFRSQEKGLSYLKASGINDIITGANRADYEASKKQLEYVRKFAKVKGFYSNENIYERGVIADLIRTNPGIDQDAEFERLVNILMNSKDMLLESKDKTKVDMGKLYDKVFKKLGLYDADADIESVKAKANKANLDAVNFVVDMFAEKYELLSDTAMSIYNTILGQDINYTPKTYLLSKMSEDDKFDMNDSGLSMYTNNFAMNEAGVLMPITRPDDLKDRYVDLNFDNNMFRSYRLALTDAYTAKSIRQLNSFYNSKENEDIIGSEKDYNIIRGQLSTYIKSIKGKNFVTKNEDRWANKFADILSTLGSVRALSGIVQFAQQFASGMGSTIIQAGEYIRPSDFTKQAFAFMDRSGQPIANVGENDILLSLTNLDKSIERATVGKNIAEMSIEWYAKMNGKVFQALVSNPDAAARRLAWMAYYRKYAVKNKLGPIDFNAEPNADAAAYAQSMLDRSMDATDARIRGEVYTSTNDAEKLLTRMFIPFSSFGMNQRTKMWGDIEKVFTGNANFDTARSLTSIVAEQAIYNTIRYYASKYILIGVMHFLGYDDEEQEELLNELKKNIESSAWAKSIVDTVSPLALVDDYVLKIANDLMDWANIAEPDKKKVDEFIKEENDKRKIRNLDPLTPDQEMRKREEFILANSMRFYISDEFSFGTMGIQAEKFSEMYEMQKALRTGSYTDDRGNEKYFDDEAKEKLAGILMLKGIAMGTPVREVDQFANKSFKLLKKGNTMSQKKHDMITEVKKKFGKLDPVLEKLAEKKNKLTSIEAEIKWINDNKGLKGSKEKEEYAKLLDLISQPSKKMLKMIQDGKTAQYIFDQELKK